jgi:hypothetical protein
MHSKEAQVHTHYAVKVVLFTQTVHTIVTIVTVLHISMLASVYASHTN